MNSETKKIKKYKTLQDKYITKDHIEKFLYILYTCVFLPRHMFSMPNFIMLNYLFHSIMIM